MTTVTEIWNMSLSHIGKDIIISNPDTDMTSEAKICRNFYDTARDYVLSDVDWGFARGRQSLAELSDPPDDWAYIYSYPNDCLTIRRIFDGSSRKTLARIPFEVAIDSDGTSKVVLTDQYQAQIVYTKAITNPTLFSKPFVVMMSLYMAHLIAYPITKKKQLVDDLEKRYLMQKRIAERSNAEEETQDELPDTEFISSR